MTTHNLPQPQQVPMLTPEEVWAMSHRPSPPTDEQLQALARLVKIAKRDTGQSRRVAEFLLAWWNAGACGGFDLTNLWSVDLDIRRDMQSVFALIAEQHHYPDHFSLRDDFLEIVSQWRPENID